MLLEELTERCGVMLSSVMDELDPVCAESTGVVIPHSIRILSGSTWSVSIAGIVCDDDGLSAAFVVSAFINSLDILNL